MVGERYTLWDGIWLLSFFVLSNDLGIFWESESEFRFFWLLYLLGMDGHILSIDMAARRRQWKFYNKMIVDVVVITIREAASCHNC